MRYKILNLLDNLYHKGFPSRRFCDAYEWEVTGGIEGRRLWPLTK